MLWGSMHHSSAERTLPDDDELVRQVVVLLQSRLGGQTRNFRISVREDGLILQGDISSHYGKQIIQEVVMQLSHIPILANDIEVQPIGYVRDTCIQ
jgi:hypothetical protein